MVMYRGISVNGFVNSRTIETARAKAYAMAKKRKGWKGTSPIYSVIKNGKNYHYEDVGCIKYSKNDGNLKIVWDIPDKVNEELPLFERIVIRYDVSPNGKISNPRHVN